MATTYSNPTRFLDEAGLEKLWERIYNGFAPRWQSYKPSDSLSNSDDRIPATFITPVEGTRDGNASLNINFVSAGTVKDANNNYYGKDIVVEIPTVKAPASDGTGGKLGLMTPEDKARLDNVGTTAETAVTMKGLKVKNTELTLTNKLANFDLQYNSTTNKLNIVDLNNSNAVLTSVDIDTMLSDAIVKGFLADVSLVDRKDGETSATGMYLKFIFTTGIGSNGTSSESQTIYVSVNDLVDIYQSGTGISVSQGTENDINDTKRTSTINLKTAATGEIGGVKIYKDNSSYSVAARTESNISANVTGTTHRNFGIELDKDDKAFVNVPITNLTVNDSDVIDDSVEIITGTDKVKILQGYAKTKDTNGDGWTLAPQYKEISFGKETNISIGTATNTNKGDKIDSSITVVTGLTTSGTNDHTIVPVTETYTFEETHLSLGLDATDTAKTITTNDANTGDTAVDKLKVLTNIEVNDHTITKTYTTFEINVSSIDTDFINGLQYKVN
jgi:hypothetical protein